MTTWLCPSESTTSTGELNLSPATAFAFRFAKTDMFVVARAADAPAGITMSLKLAATALWPRPYILGPFLPLGFA